jgi:opacity protein-like surface antigen
MKRLFAAALMFTVFVTPAFAAKHPRQNHHHYDYRYHAPKFKASKSHGHHPHPQHVSQHQAK